MSKKNSGIMMIVVVFVVGAALCINKIKEGNGYSVVYLTTGEVYIGHLTTFPDLQLKDSYILQVAKDTTDPTKSNFQLNPISEALWAPQTLHINEKNVVFYGPLLPNSKIAQTIVSKGK